MQKEKLVVATGNAHKLREIAQIFTQFEVVSQKQMGFDADVEETGETFEENALIKARAAAAAIGCPALADDSGLCVEALGGAPGVYSARYSGAHGNDEENRKLLLKNLQGQTNRRAYFKSAVAFVTPDGEEIVVEGKTHGEILLQEKIPDDDVIYKDMENEVERKDIKIELKADRSMTEEFDTDSITDMLTEKLCELMSRGTDGLYV